MSKSPSYHDVVVWIRGHRFEMHAMPFSVSLICTRVGGWELWNYGPDWPRDPNDARQIGGEYHGDGHFCITVSGAAVCGDPGEIPDPPIGDRPKLSGWTGKVQAS